MANEGNVNLDSIAKWLTDQQGDGSWADINYSDTARNNWQPVEHVYRILELSKLVAKDSAFYNGTDLLARIHQGFDFYVNYRFSTLPSCLNRTTMQSQSPPCEIFSANWYENDIREGTPYGKALFLLQGKIPDTTLVRWSQRIVSTLTKRWPDYPGQLQDGANLFWEGEGLIYKSAITGNSQMIDSTLRLFRAEGAEVDSGDGILRDRAFNQHGFIYNGGYGASYLDLVSAWITVSEGLSFGWSVADKQFLIDELLEGHVPMTHKGRYDAHTFGRGISRDRAHQSGTIFTLSKQWQDPSFGGYRQDELQEAYTYLKQGPWPWPNQTTKAYWNSDYLVHHGKDWTITWRFVSDRNYGTEQMNGENLKGWFIPFGVYWINYRPMNQALFPVMQWSMLPGLTSDRLESFPIFSDSIGALKNRGTTSFAGGVDDSTSAVIGYDYSASSVTGKKAGFFLPGYAVFMGAGISFAKTQSVGTTVDQQLSTGEIWMQQESEVTPSLWALDSQKIGDARWIWHDSVGYYFPQPDTLEIVSRNHTSSWSAINTSASKTLFTEKVFSMWLDHRKSQSNAAYAYAVVPGEGLDSFANWSSTPPFAILANTAQKQGISALQNQWTGVVFHSAGSISTASGISIQVDKPCTLILKEDAMGMQLSVADPTHIENTLAVTIEGGLLGPSASFNPQTSQTLISISLPTGRDAGKSVIAYYNWDPVTPVAPPSTSSAPLFRPQKKHDLLGRSCSEFCLKKYFPAAD